jgi:hypothetical protein
MGHRSHTLQILTNAIAFAHIGSFVFHMVQVTKAVPVIPL